MKDWEYNVTLVLSVLCIVLSIWIVMAGRHNERLQVQLQKQQAEIELGNSCQQMGISLLQDMRQSASVNQEMRSVLAKYGIDVPLQKPPVAVQTNKTAAVSVPAVRKGTAVESKTTTKGKAVKKTAGK